MGVSGQCHAPTALFPGERTPGTHCTGGWVGPRAGLTGENRRTRRKTCPRATLSTTNPTWIDPDANPGLRGERPATNDLSHGTAKIKVTVFWDAAPCCLAETGQRLRGAYRLDRQGYSPDRLFNIALPMTEFSFRGKTVWCRLEETGTEVVVAHLITRIQRLVKHFKENDR
jgi:ribosomal protein S15P/S13E